MKITKVNCPKNKYNIKCPYEMKPEFIIVHNTYNDASAMSEVSYMLGNNNKTSFHSAVDDTRVVQGIDFNRNTWNAGDGGNGKGNRKGIAIEICYSKSGGEKFEKAEKLAAEYIASLLKQYGWGIDKVKKHQDFSGKYCPHRTLDLGWDRFIKLVKSYLDVEPKKTSTSTNNTSSNFKPYMVKIKASVLNVREDAGVKYPVVTKVTKNVIYTIVDEKRVGLSKWGKLKSGAGWINLFYTKKFLK